MPAFSLPDLGFVACVVVMNVSGICIQLHTQNDRLDCTLTASRSSSVSSPPPALAHADHRTGTMLYAFTAEAEGEASVSAGERVTILHDLGDWLHVVPSTRHAPGLVPAAYVQVSSEGTSGTPTGPSTTGMSLGSQPSISARSQVRVLLYCL